VDHYPTLDIGADALKTLLAWRDRLHVPADGVARSSVIHGYSGKWNLTFHFGVWGGKTIKSRDSVTMKGQMVLHVSRDGTRGFGVSVVKSSIVYKRCRATFTVVDDITNTRLGPQGSLHLESHIRFRHRTHFNGVELKDEGPRQLIDDKAVLDNWDPMEWVLTPVPGRAELTGTHLSMRDDPLACEATITATKRH
jgi:hypothetical protein